MKTFKKIILRILLALIIFAAIAVAIIWVKSPGTTNPITDKNGTEIPGSVATIEKLNIGNLEQHLIIRGADTTKPILLFLHGGPGSPSFPLFQNENLVLEKEFVLVNWEQRGAGKSYSEDIPISSMNLEQFLSDINEITAYLQKRFKREKIYIAGHSWGTFIGIIAAYQNPELYHAYIGISQAGHQYQGEFASLNWIKEEAKKRNNQKAIQAIDNIEIPNKSASGKEWLKYLGAERKWVNAFGAGARRKPVNVFRMFAKMIINANEYTIPEKLHYEKANYFSTEALWPVLMQTDLNEKIGRMEIPVYFLQGRYDYQTPHALASSFFEQLDADEKHFFTFENSAHAPFMDEPARFNEVIVEEILGNIK